MISILRRSCVKSASWCNSLIGSGARERRSPCLLFCYSARASWRYDLFRNCFVLLVMSFVSFIATVPALAQTSITCSSNDGRRNYCAVDTRGGVQMVRQRSGSACTQGSTWGYDQRGIWVDRGCRADFVVGRGRSGGNYRPGGNISTITCSSDDGRRHYCNTDTRGGVTLANQRSGSPCTEGYSWGYDQRGIWVDRGCRADFVLGGGRRGRGNYRPPVSGGTITCSSDDGKRHYCGADTRGGVTLVNQRSGSPCRQGSTWGYDQRGIWVDRGCRADFRLGRGR